MYFTAQIYNASKSQHTTITILKTCKVQGLKTSKVPCDSSQHARWSSLFSILVTIPSGPHIKRFHEVHSFAIFRQYSHGSLASVCQSVISLTSYSLIRKPKINHLDACQEWKTQNIKECKNSTCWLVLVIIVKLW